MQPPPKKVKTEKSAKTADKGKEPSTVLRKFDSYRFTTCNNVS